NEAYMNTSVQRSGATPYGADTTTSPAGKIKAGKDRIRKDLTSIVAAHHVPYAAQATISNWKDLVTKAEKAFSTEGPTFINVLAPCFRGWRYPAEKTVEMSKLAVETGYWPLIEVENGVWKFTYKPSVRKPIADFLKPQRRFEHLFQDKNKHLLDKIQEQVDEHWAYLERLTSVSCLGEAPAV
ncbi:MAG: pyruvate ferredoxin oxidoreductase, partial [Elusimicrobia bacterium]|nr:pyruvate ferredoxin oxidoreductase [Elusimicrobiota bacterium]